jgi:hypothetical protein
LLAGKNNLIGLISGVSYERLNVIHRWVARVLFFLVTLHVIFLHLAWNAYDLGPLEYSTDSCIPTGWAVYAILIWMNISTVAPIRNFSYEFFVVQHIITFFGFIIAVMMHLPSTALYSRVYIYIPIGLYLVDRIVRSTRFAWNNSRPAYATLTPMEGGVTKICIQSKTVKRWSPGSHIFLSIPRFGPGQSHPATIASVPTSHNGELVFILKSHKGFTSRLLSKATDSSTPLLDKESNVTQQQSAPPPTQETYLALLDGPYGSSHNDFAAFDTVVLVAGSTGATFTLPILLDIASRVKDGRLLPVKRLVFLWIVKNTSWTTWISNELTAASDALAAAGIEVVIRIHVTCDVNFTTGSDSDDDKSRECSCECDKSLGPCCCVNISSNNEDRISEIEIADEKGVQITTQASSSINSSRIPNADFQSGRPDFYPLLWELLEKAEGETGVAVCGPLGLSSDVRKTVARCSDERAVHKGTGSGHLFTC